MLLTLTMIASGGLTFDDIPELNSSEDENFEYKKVQAGQHSSRSNTSDDSSVENMAGAIPIINDRDYISMVNKKKMVMREIKKNVNFLNSSDSEKENEVFKEVDNCYYWCQYGVTPPNNREIRRNKQKERTIKFSSNISIKKGDKRTFLKGRCLSNNNGSTASNKQIQWQKEREFKRKEKFRAISDEGNSEGESCIPRSTKLVRVNSAKGLKSIRKQKSIRSSNKEEVPSITPSVVTKAINIQQITNDPNKSSRAHFYKSFLLLVKLGGRVPPSHKSFDHSVQDSDDQFLQVEYPEVLWLELQAWYNGRSIEDHDSFLENARANVEKVLSEVINFKFTNELKRGDSERGMSNETACNYDYYSDDEIEEFILFTSSNELTASTPVYEKKGFDRTDKEMDANEVAVCPERNMDNESDGSKTPESKEVENKVVSIKIQQVNAMAAISDLIKKLETVENLYPNLKALTNAYPMYKDVKFVRNHEAMLLWLNICKEMYHKLYLLADWIDVDPDDAINWKDWFDMGLDFPCVKTNQCYHNNHYFSTSELLENSGNLSSLSNNYATRRSKRDKRKRISMQRQSFIEKTSTSRYRTFVEREIRDGGLIGLIKRLKIILSTTMWKARFTLAEMFGKERHSMLQHEGRATHFEEDLKRVIELLMKFSRTSEQDYTFFDAHIFICENKWAKAIQEMNLPSFLDNYLFLIRIPFDLTQESIRFRLDYKPKVEPSEHSIRQLIQECKEVVSGGILAIKYFQDMTLSVLKLEDRENRKLIEQAVNELTEDLKSMLNVYFDYLQTWFNILQKMKQASETLKIVMEEEWGFAKDMCPHVQGGETRAAYKFCVLVSNLCKSTGQYLESAVDECFSTHNPKEEDGGASQRHKMSSACREYKEVFKEVRGKAIKALGFAKLLQKDLGIAANYFITTPVDNVFQVLKESQHTLMECSNSDYLIFLPNTLAKEKRECMQLISLTCGYESLEGNSFCPGRYILLVKKPDDNSYWKGRRMTFDMSPAVALSLSYIEKVDGVTLICRNAYHLNAQRKDIEKLLGNCISIRTEQTSSRGLIEKSLFQMKEAAQKLADIIVTAVQHVGENLDLSTASEMDEADRNSIRKTCIDTMHSCFGVGFEYLREMIRLYQGHSRSNLWHILLDFSKLWMKFVMTKTEPGHGTRPRWAAQGMEFLVTVIDPSNTESLSEKEFKKLKNEMQDCIIHIIGTAAPQRKQRLKQQRSSSPFSFHRSRSVPPSLFRRADALDGPRSPDVSPGNVTLPVDITRSSSSVETRLTEKLNIIDRSENNSSSANSTVSDADTLDSIPTISGEDGEEDEHDNLPIIRVRSALQEIDERRTAKLQHMRVIGIVTNKQANFASQLVHMNVRRVNFKWQLGIKIGEGQFGKVYSAVNLDTGDLMAVKQIRFNPHDYGAIQDIADEITNIQAVQHDSLVKYFGVEVHKDEMLIFMENCGDGTIAEVAKLGLPESIVRVYTYQIVKAINFLHQNGIIHRDIKGANIFLSSSGLIKIGDFGSAVKLKDALCTSVGEVFNTRGTAAFMAPEVITLDKGRGYGRAADVWSLGCVVIEMTTGKQPWSEYDNIYAIMYKVGDGQHPLIPEHLSDEGKHFLKVCFLHDANERWTAHMLEDHLFVKIPTA